MIVIIVNGFLDKVGLLLDFFLDPSLVTFRRKEGCAEANEDFRAIFPAKGVAEGYGQELGAAGAAGEIFRPFLDLDRLVGGTDLPLRKEPDEGFGFLQKPLGVLQGMCRADGVLFIDGKGSEPFEDLVVLHLHLIEHAVESFLPYLPGKMEDDEPIPPIRIIGEGDGRFFQIEAAEILQTRGMDRKEVPFQLPLEGKEKDGIPKG